jgi:hypothetical protein
VTIQGMTASAARPGRVLPTMISSLDMKQCLAQIIGYMKLSVWRVGLPAWR